jgi:hypothetical protein
LEITATGATISVSLMECSVSGSPKRFAQYTAGPSENASMNT